VVQIAFLPWSVVRVIQDHDVLVFVRESQRRPASSVHRGQLKDVRSRHAWYLVRPYDGSAEML